jgi:hypothetical protein
VLENGFGTKSVRGDKRLAHHTMQLLFLGRECGPFDHRKIENPKVVRAELRHEVTAKPEQVADTSDWRSCEVAQTNILVYFGSKSVCVRWRKTSLQVGGLD